MAAYSNHSRASSSLFNLGDPALFEDDGFNFMMNTPPIDGDPEINSTFPFLNEMPLPTLQPQHVTHINNVPRARGLPSPPPFTIWPSAPSSNPASHLAEAADGLIRAEAKILYYDNKVLDLEIKLESLKTQKSLADDRLRTLLAEVESLRNVLTGIECLRHRAE